MGRAPCCEKMGLNKGPWSNEEDQILISYVQKHGHPNWRALPKHAGLLRCGKSCRLRWTNYLRPDIKRGNFSQEEEEMIIHLHEELGNRWSVIAAKLPGRTDNEIKNVWHTHLKKRLESHQTITEEVSKKRHTKSKCASKAASHEEPIVSQCLVKQEDISTDKKPSTSSQPSSSESSSVTEATDSSNVGRLEEIDPEMFLDESFWSETLSGKGDDIVESNKITNVSFDEFPNTRSIIIGNGDNEGSCASFDMNVMDLWYDILPRMEELPELLPEF